MNELSFTDAIRQIAERLTDINLDITGSNHLAISDEIHILRNLVRVAERPAPPRVVAENPAPPKRPYRGRR